MKEISDYDWAKIKADKLKIKKQTKCPHENIDEVVIYRRCKDCGIHKAFRDPRDLEERGEMGRGWDFT